MMQKLPLPKTTLPLIRSLNSKAADLEKKRLKFKLKSLMMKTGNQMRTSLLNFMEWKMASDLLAKTPAAKLLSWMMIDQECWPLLRKKP